MPFVPVLQSLGAAQARDRFVGARFPREILRSKTLQQAHPPVIGFMHRP